MEGIEFFMDGEDILAIVIKSSFYKEGLSFITPEDFPLQMGVHNHKKGFMVRPHTHIPIFELKNITAQEIFNVQKGKIKITIYDKNENIHSSCVLEQGDTILLVAGHSVEFLEDSKMLEFKQGPYRGAEKEKRYID